MLALFAFLLTPLAILLHELGHFVVPLALGLPAQLHPTHVSGGAEGGPGLPAWIMALQAGGGLLVTLVLCAVGTRLYLRDRSRLWALALAVAAASRLIVSAGYLAIRLFLLVIGRPYGGHPNFDEHVFARAAGVSPDLAAVAATLVLGSVLHLSLRDVGWARRFLYLAALVAAILLANLVWVALAPSTIATSSAR